MTALAYFCALCGEPMPGDTCAGCGGTLAFAPAPAERITDPQRIEMCVLFRGLGEVHRATRMRRLTQLTGRYIADYGDLSSDEATQIVIPALQKETRGVQ